jgi:hypothetical protein
MDWFPVEARPSSGEFRRRSLPSLRLMRMSPCAREARNIQVQLEGRRRASKRRGSAVAAGASPVRLGTDCMSFGPPNGARRGPAYGPTSIDRSRSSFAAASRSPGHSASASAHNRLASVSRPRTRIDRRSPFPWRCARVLRCARGLPTPHPNRPQVSILR